MAAATDPPRVHDRGGCRPGVHPDVLAHREVAYEFPTGEARRIVDVSVDDHGLALPELRVIVVESRVRDSDGLSVAADAHVPDPAHARAVCGRVRLQHE